MYDKKYVVCISNAEYPIDLVKNKIYEIIPDKKAEAESMLRIMDESGEDYLYDESLFIALSLPNNVEKALQAA